ncbi:unnamed protein product, partial [marine sediment metagenome]
MTDFMPLGNKYLMAVGHHTLAVLDDGLVTGQ